MDRFLLRKLPLCPLPVLLLSAGCSLSIFFASFLLVSPTSGLSSQTSPFSIRTRPVWFNVVLCLPSPPTRQRVPICLYSGSPAMHTPVSSCLPNSSLSMSPNDLDFPTSLPPPQAGPAFPCQSQKLAATQSVADALVPVLHRDSDHLPFLLVASRAQPPPILSSVLSAGSLRTSLWPTPAAAY